MDLKDIIAITGLGGLYKLESQRSNGVIVKELGGEQGRFIPTRTHDFTLLDNITIYDDGDGLPLVDVFIEMKKKEAEVTVPDSKADDAALRAYLEKVIPNYDKEKVYVSDMRKLVKWYRMLDGLKLVDTQRPEKEATPEPEERTKAVSDQEKRREKREAEREALKTARPEPKKKEEPKKEKVAAKKEAAPKKEAATKKEAPAKKPAAKKAAPAKKTAKKK
jgi:hypothetical protein